MPYWDDSSVSEQLADPNSILRFYIDALKLKNQYPVIHWGTPSQLTVTGADSVAAYRITGREGESGVAVVHNPSDTGRTVTITGAAALGGTLSAAGASGAKPALTGDSLSMPGHSTAVIEY
jgi:glycosidase